jgi:oligopeptidase B
MRDTDDPEFLTYLEAENAHTDRWFATNSDLVGTIDAEIRSRIQESDISAPYRHGPWHYTSRTLEGMPYPMMCRGTTAKQASDPAAALTVIDLNIEAVGAAFFDLGTFEPDRTHRLVAWSADTAGDEHYTLRIRDTASGTDLDDRIDDTAAAGVAWSTDGSTIFYVVADETERPYQVRAHRLGTDPSTDHIIWTEPDERFYVGIGATRSGNWIIIHSGSRTTSEVHLISTSDVDAGPTCVRPRVDGVEYHIDDWGDRFVIMTNDDAEDFRIMTAPHDAPHDWTEFDPHRAGRRITNIEAFDTVLAVHEWFEGQPQIRLVNRAGDERIIDVGSEPHDIEFGQNEEFTTDRIRIVHQSLTAPGTIFDVDIDTLALELIRRIPTPNIDLELYRAERRWATAPDGVLVPYDLVCHRDTPLDGSAPAVVYAYGAYEVSVPPWFSAGRLSLLDRGVIWVLAHPRGGGELGRRWYLDGRLEHKRNTFTDVLAVADDLDTSGIADPNRLAVRGGSAGGLMVGACVTMRPERFSTAVAEVPFVDVVSTMSDPTLPLTVTEWEEWGDPRREPYASYIESYSPYDNTEGKTFGSMLVTAGLNDPRVSVHEPAKWVAQMRSRAQHRGPLLLRTEMGAGHAGPSDRYAAWREEAMTLAFILETI